MFHNFEEVGVNYYEPDDEHKYNQLIRDRLIHEQKREAISKELLNLAKEYNEKFESLEAEIQALKNKQNEYKNKIEGILSTETSKKEISKIKYYLKQKENYENHGGRFRKLLNYYKKNYNIPEEVLYGPEENNELIDKIKAYIKEHKKSIKKTD